MVSSENENNKERFEFAPPSSAQVVAAWERFDTLRDAKGDVTKEISIEKAQVRSHEIKDTIYDFAGLKNLVSSVYEAAPLVELMEMLNSSDETQATDALDALRYYNSGNKQDSDYVRAVSADILKINAFIDKHFREDKPDKQIPLKDVLELVSDDVTEDVEDPEGVNIESILIAAASAHNTLRNAADISETDVLRAAYAADNFYRPLLEIIGYEAFASELHNQAGLDRMVRQSEEPDVVTPQNLKDAQEIKQKAGLDTPEKVVKKVVERLFLRDVDASSVLHNASWHKVGFGAGYIYDPERSLELGGAEGSDDGSTRLVYRTKSDYSLAEKLQKGPDNQPLDVLGITVILPTNDAVAEAMVRAYDSATDSRSMELTPSRRDRDSAVYLKGDEIIEIVGSKLKDTFADIKLEIDDKRKDNGHHVAKLTMLYHDADLGTVTPVEIAFQTADDRDVSRAGNAAHAFKYNNYIVSPEDLRVIKRLHERRSIISDAPRLTKRSQLRARELFAIRPKRSIAEMAAVGIRHLRLPVKEL